MPMVWRSNLLVLYFSTRRARSTISVRTPSSIALVADPRFHARPAAAPRAKAEHSGDCLPLATADAALRYADDTVNVHVRRVHLVGIYFPDFNEILDFHDGHLGGAGDERIVHPLLTVVNQVAQLVCLPRLDEAEVGIDRFFDEVFFPIDRDLLALVFHVGA